MRAYRWTESGLEPVDWTDRVVQRAKPAPFPSEITQSIATYLQLQGAYEEALSRAERDASALGRLCDAAWAALCEARKQGHDSNVIADDPP